MWERHRVSELIKLRKHQLPQRPRHVLVMKGKSKVRDRVIPFHSHICVIGHTHTVFHSTRCDGFFMVAADEPSRLESSIRFKKITRLKLVTNVSTSMCNPPLTIPCFWQSTGPRIGPNWDRFRHDLACFQLIADMLCDFSSEAVHILMTGKIKDLKNVKSAQAELQHRQGQMRPCLKLQVFFHLWSF